MTARQLRFDLARAPALGRADFFVSPANAAALALIEGWQRWPDGKLILTGPAGAGKTHLAHVWAGLAGARIVSARDLPAADLPVLAEAPLAVEDAHGVAGDAAGEQALLHLHNLVQAAGPALLLTARRPPRRWRLTLPDLASRMQATAVAATGAPDDALLAAVLTKLFSDRQIAPSPDTVPYLARRIERSFHAAHRVVAALDDSAMALGRPVTRALAAQVLDNSAA